MPVHSPETMLAQEGLAQPGRAVGGQRADRAFGQQRAERKTHRGAVPDFAAGEIDRMRQAHAAELRRRGDTRPAALGPGLVGLAKTVRRRDDAVLAARALDVAGAVERGDHVGGELAGLRDDRAPCPVEIAEQAGLRSRRRGRRHGRARTGCRRPATDRPFRFLRCRKLRFCAARDPSSLHVNQFAGNLKHSHRHELCFSARDAPHQSDGAAIADAAADAARGRPRRHADRDRLRPRRARDRDTAVAAIYAAKGRPSFNPLIAHVADFSGARAEAEFDARAEKAG